MQVHMKHAFAMSQFPFFKYISTLFFAALLFHGGSLTVLGDTSYSVLPLAIDEKVQPRDIITKEITITNTGTTPVTIYPTVNNISLKEGGDIEAFLAPVESDKSTSLASWTEISRLGINLRIGETRKIPVTFRISPTAVPGTYHTFLGFADGGNRDEAEARVKSGQAPGTMVSVTLEDEKVEFLKLSKFIVERFVTKKNNQAALFTFTNPGDETVVPSGEIIVYDAKGREVQSLRVNEEHVTIPPGGEHTFTTHVPIEGMFGKYKAFLSIEYGVTQRASLQDTNFFYAFPVRIMAIVFGILLIIVAILAWYVHKKYFDDAPIEDSEHLTVHVRDTKSEPKDHDLHLTKS